MKIKCNACNATGLYLVRKDKEVVGFLCESCNGKGYREVDTIEEFKELERVGNIARVFDKGIDTISYVKNECNYSDTLLNYGCSYEEFLKGHTPKAIREIKCPMEATSMALGKEPLNKCLLEGPHVGQRASDCIHYCSKQKCWEEFDSKNEE